MQSIWIEVNKLSVYSLSMYIEPIGTTWYCALLCILSGVHVRMKKDPFDVVKSQSSENDAKPSKACNALIFHSEKIRVLIPIRY